MIPKNKKNNNNDDNQGVFLELLVAANKYGRLEVSSPLPEILLNLPPMILR